MRTKSRTTGIVNAGEDTIQLLTVAGFPFRTTTSEHPHSNYCFALIHGLGMSSRSVARLHRVLEEHSTVHSIDLPGFGGLPKPQASPDVPAMAALLTDVLESIGTKPVVIVGNSMGAQWAVEAACLRPELISHVVVLGPVVNRRRRSAVQQGIVLFVDSVREALSANVMMLREYIRCGPFWYFRQLRHMLRYRIEKRVPDLKSPLLILRGGRDPVAPASWCRYLLRATPHARFEQIPKQPHLAHHTAPREVAARIIRFAEGSL